MLPPRLLLPLVLAAWLAPLAAIAVELADPAARGEPPAPPRIEEDPARTADAPTAVAIESVGKEDGDAARLAMANKALAGARAAFGPADPRLSRALTNVAIARQRTGDSAGAVRDFQEAIALTERAGGPRDPRLYDAWYGLGYTHLYAGHYGPASESLGTALQLHRINEGLYSAEQLDVLHALALSLRSLGRAQDADALQVRRIAVAQRLYGSSPADLARIYVSCGRWFRDSGNPNTALALQGEAITLLSGLNQNDPRLIEPLLEAALAGSERRRDPDELPPVGVPQPAAALARAEKLAEARQDAGAAQQADALMRVGDAHFALSRPEPGLRAYAKAAALLAGAGQPPPFDAPAFVALRTPRPAPVKGPGGFVVAEFAVDTNGRARDVRIVETQPADLPASIGSSLISAIKQSRLRPRIVAGKPEASGAVRYRLPVRGGSGP